MKASRLIRRWFRTRDFRLLRWGIPAILGCLAWLVFGICMAGWKPWQTATRYTSIAEKALARISPWLRWDPKMWSSGVSEKAIPTAAAS